MREPASCAAGGLYVFRLDRLTRSGIFDTPMTLAELRTSGVEVVSVADGFDLNGPHAEVPSMPWAAKMDRLATECASNISYVNIDVRFL
jgi:hypothetical protein